MILLGIVLGMVMMALAGFLACRPRRLAQVFGLSLAGFLFFEVIAFTSFFATPAVMYPVWLAVHIPSVFALGQERWERWANYDDGGDGEMDAGIIVGTVLHFADFLAWSALITGGFWLRGTRRRQDGTAEPLSSPRRQ